MTLKRDRILGSSSSSRIPLLLFPLSCYPPLDGGVSLSSRIKSLQNFLFASGERTVINVEAPNQFDPGGGRNPAVRVSLGIACAAKYCRNFSVASAKLLIDSAFFFFPYEIVEITETNDRFSSIAVIFYLELERNIEWKLLSARYS